MATVAEPIERQNYLNANYGWKSWLLTTDHKRIAILYLISITFMFFIGGFFATMIRLELLTPAGDLMTSDTYNKMFSMHGIVMVFFFLVPSIPATLGNFLLPMMIGAKDLAFPKINLLSWYIYIVSAALMIYVILTGGVDTGWTFYAPYSTTYSNTNVVLAGIAVFINGFSSILTGLNFIVTTHRMRAPGLTWNRLPLFVWSHLRDVYHPGAWYPGDCNHGSVSRDRTPLAHRHLRSESWRRSGALPAPVLVLLASRRVHHDFAFDGGDVGSDRLLFAQAHFRIQLRGTVVNRHRRTRVPGLGAPSFRRRHFRIRRTGVLAPQLFRGRAFRRQGLQLDRYDVQGADIVFDADALCVRLHRSVHDGWHDGTVPGQPWHRRSRYRHIFRDRALPLHHGGWRGDGIPGRDSLLVAEDNRANVSRVVGARSLPDWYSSVST